MKIAFIDIDGPLATKEATEEVLYNCHGYDYCSENKEKFEEEFSPSNLEVKLSEPYRPFSKEATKNMNKLKAITGCKYVISSSWFMNKTLDETNYIIALKGLYFKVIDKINNPITYNRDILTEWMKTKELEGANIESYVLITDDITEELLKYHPDNIVKVTYKDGFTKDCLEKAIEILENK